MFYYLYLKLKVMGMVFREIIAYSVSRAVTVVVAAQELETVGSNQ